MVKWHYRCDGHELGQTLGDGEGQGGLVCCSPWGHKKPDTTGKLNKEAKDLYSENYNTMMKEIEDDINK